MVGECGGVSDAQVYRKDLFLAVQQQLQTAGEYEERRLLKRRVDSTVNLSATKMRLKIRGSNSNHSGAQDFVAMFLFLCANWMCGCGHSCQPPASCRPFGTRSLLGPLPSKIVFPFTIQLPQWYWDAEDEHKS